MVKSKPNILFIFSDQHRCCDLGCYGNLDVMTPHLDAFASQAVRMTHCFSNAPVCVPARGCLLTGLMPNRHRAITNDLPVNSDLESIADVMNRNQYHTGYIGKWHLGGIPRDKAIPAGERLGFTEWKAYNCNHDYFAGYYYDEQNNKVVIDGYEPVGQTSLAIEFMERNQHRTWGLVLSFGTPHDPYFQVPGPYLDLYGDRELSLRENVPDRIMDRKDKYLDQSEIACRYKGYYAHITALDEQFGRIWASLARTGQLENTLVVYTSDHGDMLGSQGLTNKQLPYEESVNIPLLVCRPGQTIRGVCHEIISMVDLPVSLMGLAGMSFASQVDGIDYHRLFIDEQASGADCAYIFDYVPCHQAYQRGSQEWRGIRTRQYTYARSFDRQFCVLFDNIEDPWQMKNLASQVALADNMELQLMHLVNRHDQFLPWDQFIREHGYLEAWNKSQDYFHLPILD